MTSPWPESFVLDALGLQHSDRAPLTFSQITTDTRTMNRGALFVALSGDRFDGHDYLEAAVGAGAIGAVVRHGTPPVAGLTLYPVADPTFALGALATRRRATLEGPVVAITGSNGKTSTKEMVAAVMNTRYATHATLANLNNLIGIPLTILSAPAGTEALVLEAGASVPGEIARYREIIGPSLAIVTNAGAAHLEGFGSLEGVISEKLELVRGAPCAVVGEYPEELATRARQIAGRVVTAGLERGDVRPESVTVSDGRTIVAIDGQRLRLPGLGNHLAANSMLAWAVVRELGLDPGAAAAALAEVNLPGGRGERQLEAGLVILNDCYNANPESFRAAIHAAEQQRAGRRLIWVVGTMRELGSAEAAHHAAIAQELVAGEPDLIAAVGAFIPAFAHHRDRLGDRLITAPDVPTLGRKLAPRVQAADLVVLKASRGVALEGILPYLLDRDRSPDG